MIGFAGLLACWLVPALTGPSTAAAACGNASASTGGLSITSNNCRTAGGPVRRARLVRGRAIAPATAPARVKRVINWANRIRNKPYIYGGGHGRFNDRGYDCSGAVSYALRGGRFVRYPLASTGFMNWKRRGKGRWITVYSNPSHAYMIVAGLRFDTSMTPGNGPGWSKSRRSTPGRFTARHPARF